MFFRQIIDPLLSQHAYLIGSESTKEAILFEPERDIDRYLKLAEKNGYKIIAAAETHIHADYLSGLRQLAEWGIKVYASGAGDQDWQYEWLIGSKYNYQLLHDGDTVTAGNVSFKAIHTPGHTPEHISFVVLENKNGIEKQQGLLSGDFVFVGDIGRPDLLETAAGYEGTMKSAAGQLFDSIQGFKRLSNELMVWPTHGAGSACGKALGASPMSTVAEELRYNPSILAAANKPQFIEHILTGQPEPPYYFARMKKENKMGPAILKTLPVPKRVSPEEIEKLTHKKNAVVLDGRDWDEYRQGHIRGTLFAPLDRYFMMVTGSYIEAGTEIGLIMDEDIIAPAVTGLIRIGLDKVSSYTTPDEYSSYLKRRNDVDSIEQISVHELKEKMPDINGQILDVRNSSELTETGQIEGAEHIAFTRLLPQQDEIPKDGRVYVYCRSGNRSSYACSFLKNVGFEVTHIEGGIMAWRDSGGEVVPYEVGVKK